MHATSDLCEPYRHSHKVTSKCCVCEGNIFLNFGRIGSSFSDRVGFSFDHNHKIGFGTTVKVVEEDNIPINLLPFFYHCHKKH